MPPDEYERRVCAVQLNFIPGGAILAVSLNHIAGDGSSESLAITLICDCAKACMEGNPDSDPRPAYSFDRRPFLPSNEITAQSREQLIADNEKKIHIAILDVTGSQSGSPSSSTRAPSPQQESGDDLSARDGAVDGPSTELKSGDKLSASEGVCMPSRWVEILTSVNASCGGIATTITWARVWLASVLRSWVGSVRRLVFGGRRVAGGDPTPQQESGDSSAASEGAGDDPSQSFKGQVYRVTASDASRLKGMCRPLGDVEYLSTYDCIYGAFCRALTRARTTLKPSLREHKDWLFYHAIDLRARYRDIIGPRYFGNAVALGITEPLSADDVLGADGLSVAASSIRYSIQHMGSLKSLTNITGLDAKLSPDARVVVQGWGFPETSFGLTSWYTVNAANWDFGIGPPTILRAFDAPAYNMGVLFPDCQKQQKYDLHFCLKEEEHEMLMKDEEFRSWFQPYGLRRQ